MTNIYAKLLKLRRFLWFRANFQVFSIADFKLGVHFRSSSCRNTNQKAKKPKKKQAQETSASYDNIFRTILNIVLQVLNKCANPFNIYLSQVNNRNRRKRCEQIKTLKILETIKTVERTLQRRSGVFIVDFECIKHLFLMFLLLTLNK